MQLYVAKCCWSRGEAKGRSVRCEMCDGCATAATASCFQLQGLANSVRRVKLDGDVV